MPAEQYVAKHSWQNLQKNWLNDLKISEVSLVDNGACPQAIVALKKRDGSGTDIYEHVKQPSGRFLFQKKAKPTPDELALPTYPENQDPEFTPLTRPTKGDNDMPVTMNAATKRKKKRGKYASMLESIGKHDGTVSLEQQEAMVRLKAHKVAEKTGVSIQKAEAAIWTDLHKRGLIAPDDKEARLARITKRQQVNDYGIPKTAAEIKIDGIAATIAKRDGIDLNRAIDKAWKENAGLYSSYLEQVNEPSFQESITKGMHEDAGHADLDDDMEDAIDDGDDEDEEDDGKPQNKRKRCKCGSINKGDVNYCFNCGARLQKPQKQQA